MHDGKRRRRELERGSQSWVVPSLACCPAVMGFLVLLASVSGCVDGPVPSACLLDHAIHDFTRGNVHDVLKNESSRRLRLVLIGNSVAASNVYLSTRTLIKRLSEWRPSLHFELVFDAAIGGVDGDHAMACELPNQPKPDIVLFQTTQLTDHRLPAYYERQTPRPLMIGVSHCAVHKYTRAERGNCSYPACLNDLAWQDNQDASVQVAAQFGMLYLDLCSATRVLLHGQCAEEREWTYAHNWPSVGSASRFARLYEELHNIQGGSSFCRAQSPNAPTLSRIGKDGMHYQSQGDRLLGCILAAAAIRSATSHRNKDVDVVHPGNDTKATPVWCLAQDGVAEPIQSTLAPGWQVIDPHASSGANIPHTWLDMNESEVVAMCPAAAGVPVAYLGRTSRSVWRATKPGTKLVVSLPAGASEIHAEFYHHHDRPMGIANLLLDGRLVRKLDTCCIDDCLRQHPGQGYTFRSLIARDLDVNVSHQLEVWADLIRANSSCLHSSALGAYQLDLFALIGLVG